MAQAICRASALREGIDIVALVGPQAPEWMAPRWYAALPELPELPDLLIDFTLPEGTRTAATWSAGHAVPLLSGVTGLPEDVQAALRAAAARIPVLWSPNLSLGVNLLAELAERAASVVDRAAPVHIFDLHHQWKKDAPSGTALMLGAAVAAGRDGDASAISYESRREGEVVGEHTVTFHLQGEEFDLVHRAGDRSIFALGALDAGRWLCAQAAGFYSARDWLQGL
jgi:4-hydroxy-tetrahydrodipicolinate reductase